MNKVSKKTYEERYEHLAELFSAEIFDKIKEIIIDINNDDRLLALEWSQYIEEGFSAHVSRLAVEHALNAVMDDDATYNEMPDSPW